MRAFAVPGSIAALGLLAGCHHGTVITVGGKPLADLDQSGPAPHAVALAGPDTLHLHVGDKLAIHVSGDADAVAALRFDLDDGTLVVGRKGTSWTSGDAGGAVIDVTMPAPTSLSLGGSGKITADWVAARVTINIGGSGDVATPHVAADRLDANIAGSGSYTAAGTAHELRLNLVGSGDATMPGLKADRAKVAIAGSGSGSFTSDGEVSADIIGSGEVQVAGTAHCRTSMVGSGKLVCAGAETKE